MCHVDEQYAAGGSPCAWSGRSSPREDRQILPPHSLSVHVFSDCRYCCICSHIGIPARHRNHRAGGRRRCRRRFRGHPALLPRVQKGGPLEGVAEGPEREMLERLAERHS